MRIACVTVYDVQRPETWPTTQPGLCQAGQHITQQFLAQGMAVDFIGGLRKRPSLRTKVKWNIYRRCFGKDYYRWAEPVIVRDYGQQVMRQLRASAAEVVLCPENVVPVAALNADRPVVLWTDAPLGALIDFYPYLSNLCGETRRNILAMERRSLEGCARVVYTSQWAAQQAIALYHLDPAKVSVIPWGANLDFALSRAEVESLIDQRSPQPCRLLFLGGDWQRKGGEVALAVAETLRQRGIPTELWVVGGVPRARATWPDWVKILGFLDKSTVSGLTQLRSVISGAHFLILPTTADCSPHALAEANALGVPCLTTQVGGIPSIITEGRNGRCFPLDAPAADYCDYIQPLMENRDRYRALALTAFEEYQARLNWRTICAEAAQLLEAVVRP